MTRRRVTFHQRLYVFAVLALAGFAFPGSTPGQAASIAGGTSADPDLDRAFDFDRILNGRSIDGRTEHVQWVAALYRDDELRCGAAFVQPMLRHTVSGSGSVWSFEAWNETDTPRWAVTAAHCVVNARGEVDNTRLTILGGTVNIDPATTMSVEGERQRVLAAYVPQVDEETGGTFQTLTYANDIALLRLSSPIMETASIANNRRSIALPAVNQTNTLYFPYAAVFTAGWGKKASGQLSSPVLQEVVLPYVDPSVCHAFFDPQNLAFPPGALCAGFSTGSYAHCQGDSGGPLYYRPETAPNAAFPATEVLLGIVSWGRGCEQPGSYGKYSSTLYFSSWIIARILEYCTDPAAALRPPDEDDCLNELAPGAL